MQNVNEKTASLVHLKYTPPNNKFIQYVTWIYKSKCLYLKPLYYLDIANVI